MTETVFKALIDEANCIGCGKCIRVCPTDAIVGAKQLMHTIIPQFCTSCENCINACPTYCISLSTPGEAMSEAQEQQLTARKNQRLGRDSTPSTILTFKPELATTQAVPTLAQRKQHVADAIARVKARKLAQQQMSNSNKAEPKS